MQFAHLPLRIATGAFILSSGLSKRGLEGQAAEGLHGMAVAGLPPLRRIPPRQFARLLSTGEIALGTALLVPVVPSAVAGAGLAAFAAGLLQLYLNVPGMREPGTLRPTQDGIALAKDVWLLGAGLTLLLDDVVARRRCEPVRVRGVRCGGDIARRAKMVYAGRPRSSGERATVS